MILNRAKDYYENDQEKLRGKQEINTEIYLKKKKIKKREYGKNRYHNIKNKDVKNIKNIIARQKSLNIIIMNKIIF